MDFKTVIKDRYSCKSFDFSKKVESDKVDAILNAAKVAPTAKNNQEQRLYVITNGDVLTKIDNVTPCRYNAPMVIVVAYDRTNVFVYPGEKRDSGVEDATIVATHMLLASKNEGLDSCWINFFDPDKMKAALSLKDNEEVLMMLDLGYAIDSTKINPTHTKRKSLDETVTFIK